MIDLRKAAEMALKVLEADEAYIMCAGGSGDHQREAAKELRQALAMENFSEVNQEIEEALKQPKREWVGLTDEEMRTLKQKSVDDGMTRIVSDFEYIRSIEAKLKEKNT